MSKIPLSPPAAWFERPEEGIPTDKRITIEPEGRVYGYIALWNTCHVGLGGCTQPPKGSPSNYDYAHQGETLTAEGELIKTAVIAGGTTHAPVDMNTAAVPEYYENTGTQLMRVRYGEDDDGLWFAGALWPEVNDLQVAQIRASSVSGDWRFHAAWRRSGGQYDFAGSCFVNIPGFPMDSKGGINDRSGEPYAIAASSYMALALNDEYVFLEHDLVGADMSEKECDGTCTVCTCEKKEVVEPTEEEIVAASYQIVKQSMKKKKKKAIKADAVEEVEAEIEAEQSELSTLKEQVAVLQSYVDEMQAEKLLNEIEKNTEA